MKRHYYSDSSPKYGRYIVCRKSPTNVAREMSCCTNVIRAVTCKKCLRAIIKKTAFLLDEVNKIEFQEAMLSKQEQEQERRA